MTDSHPLSLNRTGTELHKLTLSSVNLYSGACHSKRPQMDGIFFTAAIGVHALYLVAGDLRWPRRHQCGGEPRFID